MNKFAKIILAIVAVVIIAAAGFWGGTQFAYRQVAFNTTNRTDAVSPRWDGTMRGPGNLNPNSVSPRDGTDRDDFRTDRMSRSFPGSGMMDHGYTGFPGMQPGFGFFSGGIMLLGLIFPLGILTLIVLGIIALYRVVKQPVKQQ